MESEHRAVNLDIKATIFNKIIGYTKMIIDGKFFLNLSGEATLSSRITQPSKDVPDGLHHVDFSNSVVAWVRPIIIMTFDAGICVGIGDCNIVLVVMAPC